MLLISEVSGVLSYLLYISTFSKNLVAFFGECFPSLVDSVSEILTRQIGGFQLKADISEAGQSRSINNKYLIFSDGTSYLKSKLSCLCARINLLLRSAPLFMIDPALLGEDI